jgi:anti-sigma regulatory factor (Ser/Thr protein kinase)
MRDLGVLDPEVIDTIELLVSELTTNVVKHAGGRASLQVCRNDDVIRIEVRDASPAQVPVERDVDLDATHGRGLLLVSTLASSWGYERENNQKCTWAEFNLRSMASSDI